MLQHPNCKINLGLNIMHRREDGYHNLETLFLPVGICDRLEIEPSNIFSFSQEGIPIAGDDESNLVIRAYRALQRLFGDAVGPCQIKLEKCIPFGAGLGGGSSDAAFTIKMLANLFNLPISTKEMEQLAATLGADCPFFIQNQPAFATGIGDILSPLGFNPLEGYTLLLVKPEETVSTAEAYRGITPRDQRRDCQNTVSLAQAVKEPITKWRELIVNDFEESVFRSHPLLSEIKNHLYTCGALYSAMSGSGSTIYGIFPSPADMDPISNTLSTTFPNTLIIKLRIDN